MAPVLDHRNFHEFLAAHRCVVLHASVVDTLNPFIVRHFERAHAGQVGIASVNLLGGAEWFRGEVQRTLNRTPTLLESGYYLAIDGRLTSYHTGRDAEAYGAALKALLSSRSPADTLNERNARPVIAAFDALVTRALASHPSLGPGRDPHAVLGIDPTATPEQIDDAYRQRIREYHPDRVATMAREIRDIATQRTAEINAAYAELRRRSSEG